MHCSWLQHVFQLQGFPNALYLFSFVQNYVNKLALHYVLNFQQHGTKNIEVDLIAKVYQCHVHMSIDI